MNNNYSLKLLDTIQKKYKISEYLASKGIMPKKITSTKLLYVCPLPDHQEDTASFYVWLEGNGVDHQYCHCFGCSKHLGFIGLYASLEGMSWKDAIKKLGTGIDITNESELDYIINLLQNDLNKKEAKECDELFAKISFKISVLGFDYLKHTEFDIKEMEFLDKLYKKIDQCITSYDLDSLEEIYRVIDGDGPKSFKIDGETVPAFMYRIEQWQKNKYSEIAKSLEESESKVGE
jgi:DNA primase